MYAHSVCFWQQKAGNSAQEWEDAAGSSDGARPRFIVVDGATEAYDSLRWVDQLVTSFVDEGPAVTPDAVGGWFESMQRVWVSNAPAQFTNVIEEYKFRNDGSFATFIGGELVELDGPQPRWIAAALGDTVLFHVRAGRLITHFPSLSVDDFGLVPDGVDTRPAALPQMMRKLAFGRGALHAGDLLYVATDAMAHWILHQAAVDQRTLWTVLAGLDHDMTFTELVADQRGSGRLRNDDVTLMRIRIADAPPERLVVCL
jgi:hypothetical protein